MASGRLCRAATLIVPLALLAQDTSLPTRRLMLDLIHPAANTILLAAFRGTPDWSEIDNSAKTLEQSAAALASQNKQPDWLAATRLLASAAADTTKAALGKNNAALPDLARRIDASCTDCHRHYRPAVFPPPGKGVE